MLLTALAGFGFGLSLIVAIGAQNAFVLRQGLRREHVLVVVVVCAVSDAVLILLGIAGAGAVIAAAPEVLVIVRYAGAAFLLGYGILAARRALRPAALTADGPTVRTSLAATVGTVLALTWLNPHVYLDTVVLLGSIANTHDDGRWWFGAGAVLGSVVWFTALGYGARLLQPVFAKPAAWRVLDAIIAVVMVALAVSLVVGAAH
ncbi:L-lysine exporter [Conyzicola nivalis]|uniref:Amino acid transporter n=1 Tax=Conyzicola nivalis TaxID=1477021 RepID=A0A916SSH0_9MICO|nr:LysE family transporter [Conyzicola nivalis]GGB11345.1 amino acid transporter [Conyzicola nivalis]